jgi:tRNA/tmRNA/rRNA uracil-C5-methylase (TrmA/RlmC/RlmD family)
MELRTGAMAAGGGCVARADDGRVVFVRHGLPGERVVAQVTSVTSSFLRADAVQVLEASVDRVVPPCPHAGPGRCGGCDWQHVSLPAQRRLKGELVAEQLRRVAQVERRVEVEEVPGASGGLGWRTRASFAVDGSGRIGFRRHRSHDVHPVDHCPIVTVEVDRAVTGRSDWRGVDQVEVTASPDGSPPVLSVRSRADWRPPSLMPEIGLVVNGRAVQPPDRSQFRVDGRPFEVGAGVFWQVHPGAAALLTECVMAELRPERGERAADLYAGAGLFTVALAHAVGSGGRVVAVERNRRACDDLVRNTSGLTQVETVRASVDTDTVARRVNGAHLVVLDPARQGAGPPVMTALALLDPAPRKVAYVSCDPASFARDVRIMIDRGWSLGALRGFDLFPMTEHVEVLGILEPPSQPPG